MHKWTDCTNDPGLLARVTKLTLEYLKPGGGRNILSGKGLPVIRAVLLSVCSNHSFTVASLGHCGHCAADNTSWCATLKFGGRVPR